ncbi:MAG: hypothetical protein DRJ07_13450 [Bacteroidetes bacterium]|nr:MAG: hypothetical protein DRJ07_13450 [Bacteroidota bacterium]
MSLQHIHRPKTFEDFVGNKEVIEAIQNAIAKDSPPPAFLFTGGAGTGKTSIGRVTAIALGCHPKHIDEKDSADDRSIESVRKMKTNLKFTPMVGTKKVVLLDEIHQMLKPAQNALLKVLEEPPSHAHIILCTTNPENLLDTIKRRCHIYQLAYLTVSDQHKLLKRILKKEKVKKFPPKVLDKIVDLANGSAGNALKYLDMVIDFTDVKKALNTLKSAGATQSDVAALCRVLCNSNMSKTNRWYQIQRLLKTFTAEAESSRRPILNWLSKILMDSDLDTGAELSFMMTHFEKNFFDSGMAGLRAAFFRACSEIEE